MPKSCPAVRKGTVSSQLVTCLSRLPRRTMRLSAAIEYLAARSSAKSDLYRTQSARSIVRHLAARKVVTVAKGSITLR